MVGKNSRPSKPVRLPSDELDRIIGGMADIITLFRVECGKCGWLSETSPTMPGQSLCPECGAASQYIMHYAYIHGEWLKIEP